MKKRVFRLFAVAFLWFCAALAASALEDIPVYGPARVAVEDPDLLANTVLEVGVLAVTPEQPYRVVIGDGITPGGIPIHPEGCVTQFNQIANATTNLNMHSYSITFGSWSMSGGLDEFGLTWGGSETWLRLVRDTGIAFLSYDFTIIDAEHYRFELVWTGEGYDFPVLMVSTNLLQGYAAADPDDVTYSRPDVSHLVVEYSVPGDYEFLGFRFFAPDRMKTGAYFGVPVHADYGLAAVGSLSVTGRVESYYDEHAEENRDRYVPGSITIDGEEVATTGAVAAVAADLATHAGDTDNPHGVTFAQVLEADEDGMRDDFGMSFSGGDGISALSGFGRTIEVETGTFLGDWHFDERPSVGTNGLATTNEVASAVSAHAADTNNPHHTTPDGIGMLDWLRARGFFVSVDHTEGISRLEGFGNYLSFEEYMWELPGDLLVDFAMTSTNKTWNFQTPEPPKWKGVGLATTNALAASVSNLTASISNLAVSASNSVSNVNARVDALSSVVGTIDADYVTSSDIADFATTQAVASVERRVSALEYPETCRLFWTNTFVVSNMAAGSRVYVPTNFPTRRLELVVDDTDINDLIIVMPISWTPSRDVDIEIYPTRSGGDTNRSTSVRFGTSNPFGNVAAGNSQVIFYAKWVASDTTWTTRRMTMASRKYFFYDGNSTASAWCPSWPATVEEWKQASGLSDLSFSPSLSPSLSPTIQPATFAPATLAPAAFAPDDFTDDDPTDPYAVPDAIDHQEESSNLEFEDFAAFDDPADESEAAPEPEESR